MTQLTPTFSLFGTSIPTTGSLLDLRISFENFADASEEVAIDSLMVTGDVSAEADLVITKTDSPDPVIAGDQLTYTIRVSNAGPDNAQNVVVTDTLPAGVSNATTVGCVEDGAGTPTCTLGTIAAGGSAMYTIAVDVDADTLGTITNTASGTTTFTDPVWTVGDLPFDGFEKLTVVMTVSCAAAGGTDVIDNTATLTHVNETDTDPVNNVAYEATSINRLEVVEVLNDPNLGDVLLIGGSDGDDDVQVLDAGSQLRVQTDLNSGQIIGDEFINKPDVDQIVMILCDGHDQALIGSGVNKPSVMDGGAGNDLLQGGQGRDIILGSSGDDQLQGNQGNDALVGGAGEDDLHGGDDLDVLIGGLDEDTMDGAGGEDILVGGFTSHDTDIAALDEMLSKWELNLFYETRIIWILRPSLLNAGINVFDDGFKDELTGGSERD